MQSLVSSVVMVNTVNSIVNCAHPPGPGVTHSAQCPPPGAQLRPLANGKLNIIIVASLIFTSEGKLTATFQKVTVHSMLSAIIGSLTQETSSMHI